MTPIRPEMKGKYPPRKEWLAIRAEILARAGNQCEHCGIANYAVGFRNETDGMFTEVDNWPAGMQLADGMIRIVLTIAHLDHNPENNGTKCNRPNLKALCQKDHLTYDAHHHAMNARATRIKKKGQTELSLW